MKDEDHDTLFWVIILGVIGMMLFRLALVAIPVVIGILIGHYLL